MSNKRKHKRFDCLVPVEGQDKSAFNCAKTTDFSRGGLGFLSFKKYPINQQVAVELELPGKDESVLVQGKVCWVQPISGSKQYRIGMSFENVFHGSKAPLNNYFKKLEGKRYASRY